MCSGNIIEMSSDSIKSIKNTGLKKFTVNSFFENFELNEFLRTIIIKSLDTLEHIDIESCENTS